MVVLYTINGKHWPLLLSFVWKDEVQQPWWGMLLAFALACIVTLPNGVIQATTNQENQLQISFSRFTDESVPSPGHCMRIPRVNSSAGGYISYCCTEPCSCMVDVGQRQNNCDIETVHSDNQWTCPKYRVTFHASVKWGLIGPKRPFGPGGMYRNLVWLFLTGAVLPVSVWVPSKMLPEKKWIPLINIPVISNGFAGMPPATPTNIASWLIPGMIFKHLCTESRSAGGRRITTFRQQPGCWNSFHGCSDVLCFAK